MLVSTKYLSLMKFVSRGRRRPVQFIAVLQACLRATPRLLIATPLAHSLLQPLGHKGADGRALFRRKNSRLLEQFGVNLQGYICLHGSTAYRAARLYVRSI